ncbi:MAG: hypothetical protein HZC28_09895 [Spirochaetes bacterium]|nr:hypothetical protein [Spirochaetota bacterium]
MNIALKSIIPALAFSTMIFGAETSALEKKITVNDAGFEGTSWWYNKSQQTADDACEGKKSLRFSGNEKQSAVLNSPFEAAPGIPLRISISFKNRGGSTDGDVYAAFIEYTRAGNVWVKEHPHTTAKIPAAQSWEPVRFDLAVPVYDRATSYLKLAVGVVPKGSIDLLADRVEAYTAGETQKAVSFIETLRAPYSAASPGVPSVDNFRMTASAGQYEKIEASFNVQAAYRNVFDPEDILVNAVITKPDGYTVTIPAFFMLPLEPENGLTQMLYSGKYRTNGPACWMVRYAGDKPGAYAMKITVRDAQGVTAESTAYPFTVTVSKKPGFVRVSTANPNYFERSDGSAFFGCGANVPWTRLNEKPKSGAPSYENYFGRAAGMMNATRVWLCHWAWLEWTPQEKKNDTHSYAGLGYYNQHIAAHLDRVIALAESNEYAVMLTLEDNNEHMGGTSYDAWKFNPYNVENGGVVTSFNELLKSETARKWYKKRLRYIIARWGYSRSLWALNGFNDYDDASPDALSFITEARDYLHKITAGWRPIIYGANYKRKANERMDYSQGVTSFAKPGVAQECYYTDDITWFRETLHTELWDNLAKGIAAVMVWEHTMVDRTDSWDLFRNVLAFTGDIALSVKPWKPATVRVTKASAEGSGFSRVIIASSYGDVPDWGVRAPKDSFVIDTTENAVWLEGMSRTLYGKRGDRKDWRLTPSFTMDMPGPGKFIARVDEIGGGSQTMVASVDGNEVQRRTYGRGRRYLTPDEMWFEVPLPAGKHTVMLENAADDWLRAGKYYVVIDVNDPKGLVGARGLSAGDEAFAYLPNQTYGQLYRNVLKREPVPLTDVAVAFEGLADGAYRVIIMDPFTGTVTSDGAGESSGGKLAVTIKRLERDAAVKVKRK